MAPLQRFGSVWRNSMWLSQSIARLQMPQVASEGLSDDVKRAIIQTAENTSQLAERARTGGFVFTNEILKRWIQLRTGCAFQKGDTWQNDLGHVCLCWHQRWLSRSCWGMRMRCFQKVEPRSVISFHSYKLIASASTNRTSLVIASINKNKA